MANLISPATTKAPSFISPAAEAATSPIEQLIVAQEKIAEANQAKQDDLVSLMQRKIEQLEIENKNLEKEKELLSTQVADKAQTVDALQRKLAFEALQIAQDAATIREQKDVIADLRMEGEDLGRLVEVYKVYKELSVLNVSKYSGSNSPYTSKAYAMYDKGEMYVKFEKDVDHLLEARDQKIKK